MKQLSLFALTVIGTLILGSCSTSNNVVGGGIFQKRKYTGGVYWDRSEKLKSTKGDDVEFDISKNEIESQKKYVSSTTIYSESSDANEVVASNGNSYDGSDNSRSTVQTPTLLNESNSTDGSLTTLNSSEKEKEMSVKNFKQNLKNKSLKAHPPKSSGNTGNILMIILLVILLIIAFTLLNNLLGGLLSWILGIIILVLIIYFLLRLLGIV